MIHPPDVIDKYAPDAIIGMVGSSAAGASPAAPAAAGGAAAPLLAKMAAKKVAEPKIPEGEVREPLGGQSEGEASNEQSDAQPQAFALLTPAATEAAATAGWRCCGSSHFIGAEIARTENRPRFIMIICK